MYDSDKELIRRMAHREPAFIYENDETGELVWAVSYYDMFWLNALTTLEGARAWAIRNDVPLIEINDIDGNSMPANASWNKLYQESHDAFNKMVQEAEMKYDIKTKKFTRVV